jgi:hypothetical protein
MYIKYLHIVQILSVENGEPNLNAVLKEKEFVDPAEANQYIKEFNIAADINGVQKQAVYLGLVNTETGELV